MVGRGRANALALMVGVEASLVGRSLRHHLGEGARRCATFSTQKEGRGTSMVGYLGGGLCWLAGTCLLACERSESVECVPKQRRGPDRTGDRRLADRLALAGSAGWLQASHALLCFCPAATTTTRSRQTTIQQCTCPLGIIVDWSPLPAIL